MTCSFSCSTRSKARHSTRSPSKASPFESLPKASPVASSKAGQCSTRKRKVSELQDTPRSKGGRAPSSKEASFRLTDRLNASFSPKSSTAKAASSSHDGNGKRQPSWVCDVCKYVVQAKSDKLLPVARHNQIQRWHKDEDSSLFHTIREMVQKFDVAPAGVRPDAEVGWCCGYCLGTLPRLSQHTLRCSCLEHLRTCAKAPRKTTLLRSLEVLVRMFGGSYGPDLVRAGGLARAYVQYRTVQGLRPKTSHDLRRLTVSGRCLWYCPNCTATWKHLPALQSDINTGADAECKGRDDRPRRLRYRSNKLFWSSGDDEFRKALGKAWGLNAAERWIMGHSCFENRSKHGAATPWVTGGHQLVTESRKRSAEAKPARLFAEGPRGEAQSQNRGEEDQGSPRLCKRAASATGH